MAEIASKTICNWRRYPSSNCYKIDENMRFLMMVTSKTLLATWCVEDIASPLNAVND